MTYPETNSLILVAFIPSPRDLEIARILGWYRIPLRKAPKVIAADYLAFYQPGSFGKAHGQQIAVVAPVLGHELTTRRELIQDEPDHPRAREEYFKIQLGGLINLRRPIPAGNWKRITFFYTTGAYLLNANSIPDLIVESDERKVLWRQLRDRALHSERYQVDDLPELAIEPEILALLGLMKGVRDEPGDYD